MSVIVGATGLRSARARALRPIQIWLYAVAALIVAMMLVGGATRLTDSGLSITEWKPIYGIIPPLDEAEWQEEFARYQQIPEFRIVNPGMTIEAFRTIFWWEWAHRVLGRLIGVAFALPLVWFWATGRIGRGLAVPLLGILALGALQGAVGWWMVASGLVERTDVSQYRLAVHLTLAFAILALVVWVARGPAFLGRAAGGQADHPAAGRAAGARRGHGFAAAILIILFVQVFLGGLVAGLDAGLVSSTWPTMDGRLVPDGLWILEPWWRNLFENPVTVQFDHRMVAYLILVLAVVHALRMRQSPSPRGAWALLAVVVLQAAIGIAAVVHEMPLFAALLHQLGAAIAVIVAVTHLRDLSPPGRALEAPGR